MEKLAYLLIGSVGLLWLLAMIAGMISIYPLGLIGLVVLASFGLLFFTVLGERLANREDDHYDETVNQ